MRFSPIHGFDAIALSAGIAEGAMMTDDLIPFLFNSEHMVRVVTGGDGEPWFVAADVCLVLGLRNPSRAIENFDEDEKGLTTSYTLGGNQELLTVSESGLYALIFRSRKPVARQFRKWVTAEVLPSIRKTGQYTHDDALPQFGEGSDGMTLEQLRVFNEVIRRYDSMFGRLGAIWIAARVGMPIPPKDVLHMSSAQPGLFDIDAVTASATAGEASSVQ